MKAAIYSRYGPPEVLQIAEVEKPTPNDDQVLIKVRAASINPYDWHFMRGTPYLLRIAVGLRKPKNTRLGVDMAGEVEAVGKNVTKFRSGDAVFGSARGAFAEYVCARESAVAAKPENASFEQMAAVPMVGYTALQGLRNKGKIQAGQKVLINGAAGGVGTMAVQIAKSFGADVTGVCSTGNLEMVRSIGADQVVDYTKEDFTKSRRQYDLILDCVSNHSLWECRRVLAPKGIYAGVGAAVDGSIIGVVVGILGGIVLSWFVSQKFTIVSAKARNEDLAILGEMVATGKLKPVIDKSYKLSETTQAIRYSETGHVRGKVVISLE